MLRRALLAATLATPAAAREARDAAGRAAQLPDRIARVFAAGPPAAILLYTLAPDTLAGWPSRPPRPAEAAFLLDEAVRLPETGRLTNQALVLREIRALARRDGLAVLMTTHQPDHALMLADSAMLLASGMAQGPMPPEALITEATLRAAYGVEAVIGSLGTRRVVAPLI